VQNEEVKKSQLDSELPALLSDGEDSEVGNMGELFFDDNLSDIANEK